MNHAPSMVTLSGMAVIRIHFHGVDGVLEKLAIIETNIKEYIMATK